jgi:hypothetical protein
MIEYEHVRRRALGTPLRELNVGVRRSITALGVAISNAMTVTLMNHFDHPLDSPQPMECP